ncbi:MAG: hypothetical protein A2750_02945 [Candidatus Yanofskybacteria bacterium RIFCSPHIGHO2_01_FULL_45_42]|uniref:M23ase beta-sheet core domain-containing protein n=2 Tax=Candidatus Yanofskyibacteriota TaxID=1752733 RepID=A0A1F8F165_9BACT|nr:MAG: hypothetical protein A2750_02945 [Candidatus Yanofskybacteria bacterium RIFCSPHIGHO2_01_FULL_45_42]OGN31655.1 MAG: hypothetical protein A3J01_02015 [Candidatus Yanofskybacteria bacterium RIFCSPLOWO2_02_FULL_45_18]
MKRNLVRCFLIAFFSVFTICAENTYTAKQASVILIDLPAQTADTSVFLIIFRWPFYQVAANRVLVAVDVEQEPGIYPISLVQNLRPRPFGQLTVRKGVFPKINLPRIYVDSQKKVRLEEEESAIVQALGSGPLLYPSQQLKDRFDYPLEKLSADNVRSYVSDGIGSVRTRLRVWPDRRKEWHTAVHRGVDLKARYENVKAINPGMVVLTGNYLAEGQFIVIYHGSDVYSLYMHLSKIYALTEQYVAKGEIIAQSGESGNATGPCLHFAIRAFGASVNPLEFIEIYNPFLE